MASPPSEAPKRRHIGKSIRRGYDRFKHALLPPSPPPSQNAGSGVALSAGASSLSPGPSAMPSSPTATGPVLRQRPGIGGPSTLGASLGLIGTAIPQPTTADKLVEVGKVTCSGLETALQMLDQSADAFLPLKSAVGGSLLAWM